MGLDMYLISKSGKELAYWRKANAVHGFFEKNCAGGDLENCKMVRVKKSMIALLKEKCQKILMLLENAETVSESVVIGLKYENGGKKDIVEKVQVYTKLIANQVAEILPPTQGFFFGGYEIDKWYKTNIEETYKMCSDILETFDFSQDSIRYLASW